MYSRNGNAALGMVERAWIPVMALVLLPAFGQARAAELQSTPEDPLTAALTARLDSLGDPSLDSVYARPASPIWVEEGGITAIGRSALETLSGAEAEGIASSRYALDDLARRADMDGLSPSELSRLDTDLTRTLGLYAADLANGLVASIQFDPEWRLDSLDVGRLPTAPTDGGALLDHLGTLRPRVEQYDRLQQVLSEFREVRERGGWDRVQSGEEILLVGDSASAVARLRIRLQQSSSAEERRLASENDGVPALFDTELWSSLSSFQSRHDIVTDGILGPETAAALDTPVEERIAQVELALERWRWLPADLGELAVLVNTPERRVHVIEDGAATLSMKAVIGQRDWRTALFQDEMEEIVVNPYWNVPESIMRAETLPNALADEDYMRDNAFEVIDPESGDVVPLDSVRWEEVVIDSVAPDSTVVWGFPYRIRQEPGEKNALGRMKFMFPNAHAIYLHDTPEDHLFDDRLRTFSHGCVRLERPVELAHLLLSKASSHAPSELDSLLATGERHALPVEPIPVYLVYQTVWVDESGAPVFTPDVYDRNQAALKALAKANADAGRALAERKHSYATAKRAADTRAPGVGESVRAVRVTMERLP